MTLDQLAKFDLRPLDMIAVRYNDAVMRAISWITKHRGEQRSKANHIDIAYNNAELLNYSWRHGARFIDVSERSAEFYRTRTEWAVYRSVVIYRPQEIIRAHAMMQRDQRELRYSIGEIALQLIDGSLGKLAGRHVVWARKLSNVYRNNVVCSTGSNRYPMALGRLPQDAYHYDPDHTTDYFGRHPESWDCAAHSPGW